MNELPLSPYFHSESSWPWGPWAVCMRDLCTWPSFLPWRLSSLASAPWCCRSDIPSPHARANPGTFLLAPTQTCLLLSCGCRDPLGCCNSPCSNSEIQVKTHCKHVWKMRRERSLFQSFKLWRTLGHGKCTRSNRLIWPNEIPELQTDLKTSSFLEIHYEWVGLHSPSKPGGRYPAFQRSPLGSRLGNLGRPAWAGVLANSVPVSRS